MENITSTDPVVIREEKDYNVDELHTTVQETVEKFTDEQAAVFEAVMIAVSMLHVESECRSEREREIETTRTEPWLHC